MNRVQKIFGSYAAAILFIVFTVLIVVSAIQSKGFYHWDEHYQIIEFASYKMGITAKQDLPWEFVQQIRSAVQPFVAFVTFKVAAKIGIHSPFTLSLFLRLLTAFLCVFTSLFSFIYVKRKFANMQSWIIALILCCFWFVPFIGVRFASETWSACFLCIGTIVLLMFEEKPSAKLLLIAGFILGLAFLFRFQSLVFSSGLIIWLLIKKRIQLKQLVLIALPIMLCCFGGLLIDRWFYGNFVFTPLKYLHQTLIGGNHDRFGTMPWYFYFTETFKYAVVPISIFIFCVLVVFVVKKYKHPLFGGLVLFVVAHILIPHKELRFLFPLVFFVPIIFVEVFSLVSPKNLKIIAIIFAALNLPLLLYVVNRPAHTEIADIEFVNRHKDHAQIYYTLDNPAKIYGFYALPSEQYLYLPINAEAIDTIQLRNKESYVFLTNYDMPKLSAQAQFRLKPVHNRSSAEIWYFQLMTGLKDSASFSRTLYRVVL